MKKREFQYDLQRSVRANIIRLHRYFQSIDPAYKPPLACVARRKSAAFRKVTKWKR